jgi:hypothetical protein
MSVDTITAATAAPAVPRELSIDFLFLDLTTCTRCRGTDRSLDAALTQVASLLRAAGIGVVVVNKVQVLTEDQARDLRFVSSPTIRVDGADIALELRESSCGSEACTDGCGDHIACRVWVYDGREYTEPPVGMVVDGILRHVYGSEPAPAIGPYAVPENLRRFFAGRTGEKRVMASTQGPSPTTNAAPAPCCAPAQQDICCAPADKQECCGAGTEQGCGCQ